MWLLPVVPKETERVSPKCEEGRAVLPLGALGQSQLMLFHGKALPFNHVLESVQTELAHLSPGTHPSPFFTFLLLAMAAAQEGQFGFEFLRICPLFLSLNDETEQCS